MIIAVIAGILALILSGGLFSFDYIGDAAKEVIKDKDRAKQVVFITEQADEEFEKFAENVEALSRQLVELNGNYNLTREEMDSFSIQVDTNRTKFLNKYIELRFELKDLVTAEEWQQMHAK